MKRLHPQIAGAMAALAMLLPVSPAAHAGTYTWNNTGTDFATAGDWTPSGPPGQFDVAQFNWLGTLTDGTINNPVLSGSQSVQILILGGQASGDGWAFSGSGSLNTTLNVPNGSGLISRAGANTSFDLGDGTAVSLHIIGQAGNTAFGGFEIGHGSTVTLKGNTVATLTGSISLRGGSLVLDNSAGNPTSQRITLASSSQSITLAGGGATVEFKSAAGGSTFSGLNAGVLSLLSGDGTVKVNQTGSGALAVTFGSLSLGGGDVNFLNTGNGTLGGGGAGDPSIKFTTAPGTTNGVISPGQAIYNGTDFANYDATKGVIAATATNVSGALASASTTNINITGNATTSGAASFNTVKITPSAAGQSLALGGNLTTNGILLTGSTDYSITGQGIGGSSTRFIWVTNPSTTLSTDSNFAAVNQNLNKCGPGFLMLTGTSNQVAFTSTSSVNLFGGTMRVTSTNFGSTNVATAFNGGVLEYDVSAAPVTFSRALGTGSGSVRWGSSSGLGSGGFSAYAGSSNGGNGNGNALTVNLGGSSATETWGSTTNFLTDDYALIFGSTKSNSTVNWQNPINLDSGAGNYQVREIKVIKGVGNAADKTIMSGAIAGSSTTDLLKTGDGTLELDAHNTYTGATQVREGKLVLGNATDTLSNSGTVIVNGGELALGANSDTVGPVVLVSGSITGSVGTLTGSSYNVRSGTVSANLGGSGTLTKNTSGTVTLSGANTYTGATTANGGSLFINGNQVAATGTVTVNSSGTTLGGSGTIGGAVNVASAGANLSPGASGVGSVGKLNTGALTLAAASNFNIDISGSGTVAGTNYDQLSVTGTVNINGSNLVVNASGLTQAQIGNTYYILLNDGTDAVTGMFAQGATVTSGSDVFLIIYLANGDMGTVPNDISLTLTAVPEPATWLASTLALAVLGYKQRRRVARVFKSV